MTKVNYKPWRNNPVSEAADDTFFVDCANCNGQVLISKQGDKCYFCEKSATEKEKTLELRNG